MVLSESELENLARRVRGRIIEMAYASSGSHVGSALSCADILAVLYGAVMRVGLSSLDHPDRDRFVLGKGHAASALYAVLAEQGFFPPELLSEYNRAGGRLPDHPAPGCAPGIEAASGSLGHGLSIALGLAAAARIQKRAGRVFVLLGDGECNEGSVWEAAMLASALRLGNLLAVVDFNKWQATGRSCEVCGLEPLAEKWRAFGWRAHEVDGHDIKALSAVFGRFPDPSGRPSVVIAHTVKGKGVSFMEDDNNWHYRVPDGQDRARALAELGLS
ncbi:MAG: transketolase [Thermodesulfobacteriota bacterium]